MLWSEVKKYAKQHGYETVKDKGDESKGEKVCYYWSKIDDPACSGVAKSVSKLAKVIYNNITNNIWVEHQDTYSKNLKIEIKPDGY
jgi:hypothetical protein